MLHSTTRYIPHLSMKAFYLPAMMGTFSIMDCAFLWNVAGLLSPQIFT